MLAVARLLLARISTIDSAEPTIWAPAGVPPRQVHAMTAGKSRLRPRA